MSIKKSFKLLLSTLDVTKYTGTASNCNFPISLQTLGLSYEDLGKKYKMTFYYQSALDTTLSIQSTSATMYFISVILGNGAVQRRIYNTTGSSPTGIIKVKTDTTNTYTRSNVLGVTGTIATNRVQLVSNAGLIAGQTITFYGTGSIYGGTDFGGLVNGQQYIISSVLASNQISLSGITTLTTATGTMTGITNYSYQIPYLEALPIDNQPSYIDNLIGVNNVNIQITTNAMTSYLTPNINNSIVLYFEEI